MQHESLMVPLVMFGWIPVVLLMFACMPPRRAAIMGFLFGWMFLPDVVYHLSGVPSYNKTTAATLAVFLGALVFDFKTLAAVRPHWADIPVIVWCLCPFASSVTNGLGAYDGTSAIVTGMVTWGLPYLIGRAYLKNLESFRELAVLLFISGIIYAPLCLWEIRMSPQLNRYLYGFGGMAGSEYLNELGAWGSRPRVFMTTGLAVGTFMTAASLAGVWIWKTRVLRRLWGYSAGSFLLFLVAVTVLCKNMGALSLLLFGLTGLFVVKWFRSPAIICFLILAAPLYMGLRATGVWSAESMVEVASMVHEQRGASLGDRLRNDSMLADKALQRPAFGWGGWGRARIYREDGRDLCTTDGLWIIAFGNTGIVGLSALTATLLLPPVLFLRRYPVRFWVGPRVAPAAAMSVLVVLYMIDNLFNSMFNPVYVMAAAGLVSLVVVRAKSAPHPWPRSAFVPHMSWE